MPKGMRLKSEGFASSLYDAGNDFSLGAYCAKEGLPYQDIGLPVPLNTFTSYGLEFQKRYVPQLETAMVVSLRRCAQGFELRLEDGEVCRARNVIVAVGLTHFDYTPTLLSSLPAGLWSHSSAHHTVDQFRGRTVAVVGGGSSATDLAALLRQEGADVHLVARTPTLRFHSPPRKRSLWEKMRAPNTGLAHGWDLVFCTKAPLVFHRMPLQFRLDFVRRTLGPAPGWFIKQELVGKVPFHLGVEITDATARDSAVRLQLTDKAGARQTLVADHVIAATGYRVDLRRLKFIDADLRSRIEAVEQTPILSSNFESSVPRMFFVGTAAANSFGSLLRFAYGARFAARRLSKHLAKQSRSAPVLQQEERSGKEAEQPEEPVYQ